MTAPVAEKIDEAIRHVGRQRNVAGRVLTLGKYEGLPYFKQAMFYAFNPYVRFGVTIKAHEENFLMTQPPMSGEGLDIDASEIWELLDQFKTSTASSTTKMSDLTRLFAKLSRPTAWIVLGILKKNLIVGLGVSTINKAWSDFIPTFSVQLATKYTDRKIKAFPAYVEPKYDGVRATGIVLPTGDVSVMTRTGRDIPAAAYFHDDMRAIARAHRTAIQGAGGTYTGTVIDGELLGESFNNTVSVFRRNVAAESGTFNVFDLLPMSAVTDPAFISDPYTERRVMLCAVMDAVKPDRCALAPTYKVSSKKEIWDIYGNFRAIGYEGIIVKPAKGLWQRKRTNDWMKVKAEETVDIKIIGGFEGEGEMVGTLGGLITDFKGVKVRVGSGFTHNDRAVIWAMFLRDLARSEHGEDDFELIGRVVEVQYQEVTPDGSLRHPVFVRLRPDKDEVSF